MTAQCLRSNPIQVGLNVRVLFVLSLVSGSRFLQVRAVNRDNSISDNSAQFVQKRAFLAVLENLPAGTGFGRVSASDMDAGLNGRLSYRLHHLDRHFQINPHTAEISTRHSLDRELKSSYQIIVVAQDGGTPPRSSTCTAFITVLDENDNTPSFTHARTGRELLLQVLEGQPPGFLLGTIQAKDPDYMENGTIFFSMSGPRAEHFSLNPHTGELRSASRLNHSDRPEYSFTILASDRGLPPRCSTTALRIQVQENSTSTTTIATTRTTTTTITTTTTTSSTTTTSTTTRVRKFIAAAVHSQFDDCPDSHSQFCFHGTCRFLIREETPACLCHSGFVGMRCEHANLLTVVASNHRQQTVAPMPLLCVVGSVLLMLLCT